jgi:hypothetical protein
MLYDTSLIFPTCFVLLLDMASSLFPLPLSCILNLTLFRLERSDFPVACAMCAASLLSFSPASSIDHRAQLTSALRHAHLMTALDTWIIYR